MKILIIFPHKNALLPTSGATTRTWCLVKSLIESNFDVSILHSIDAKNNEDKKLKQNCKIYYHKELKIIGLREKFFNDINPFFFSSLYKVLKNEKFDIIQLQYPFGFFILKLLSKKNNKLIYDSMGIESEFVLASIGYPGFPKSLYPIVKLFTKVYEKYVCKLVNIIINVSDIDRNFYINNYKISRNKTILIQIPSSININDENYRSERKKIDLRKKLDLPLDKTLVLFHGNLPHPPNREAVDLIQNYIAPKFKNGDIYFVISGNNTTKFNKENIISLDFVEDLKALLYSVDFAIMPIISGEGQKVKCSDYIITATPFISTKKGMQGIDILQEGKDFLLYDNVNKDFINGIELLHTDLILRQKLHENLLKKSFYFSQTRFGKRFFKLFSKLARVK